MAIIEEIRDDQREGNEVQHREPAEDDQRRQQEEQPNLLQRLMALSLRAMILYWILGWFRQSSTGHSSTSLQQPTLSSIWPAESSLSALVFVDVAPNFQNFSDRSKLVWEEHDIPLGSWDKAAFRSKILNYTVPQSVAHNGSLYAHLLLARGPDMFVTTTPIVRYLPKYTPPVTRNLMMDEPVQNNHVDPAQKSGDKEIVSYWYANITFHLIADAMTMTREQVQANPLLYRYIRFTDAKRATYFPIVYPNDFWMFLEDLYHRPLNSSVTSMPLYLDISPLSLWKFQMMVQMGESFKLQKSMFGSSDQELENMKRMFFDTNPYLLVITFVVSLLHSLFDFLAFKNDVQFWRKQKSFEGLSLRSILLNVFMQAIVFLYLFDNETSWLIIVSNAVGLLIEAWKVKRALIISIDSSQSYLNGFVPFRIVMQERYPSSKVRKETDKYDAIAFRYLGIASVPLLIGYAIYSVLYESHKGWYSWVLGTAVGFVYTFGFITMTPQLFINYKLKSVAHMPWRTFMYKALNTFVDDLFAFVIKMPFLHRLACFRDDVVFLIYLYQRWIYPVDKKRANEFGQVGAESDAEHEDEEVKEKED